MRRKTSKLLSFLSKGDSRIKVKDSQKKGEPTTLPAQKAILAKMRTRASVGERDGAYTSLKIGHTGVRAGKALVEGRDCGIKGSPMVLGKKEKSPRPRKEKGGQRLEHLEQNPSKCPGGELEAADLWGSEGS